MMTAQYSILYHLWIFSVLNQLLTTTLYGVNSTWLFMQIVVSSLFRTYKLEQKNDSEDFEKVAESA